MNNDNIFLSHKSLSQYSTLGYLLSFSSSSPSLRTNISHFTKNFRGGQQLNESTELSSINGPTSKTIKPRFHHFSLLFIVTARQIIIQGQQEGQKLNMFRLTKQKLCKCITLFCIYIFLPSLCCCDVQNS